MLCRELTLIPNMCEAKIEKNMRTITQHKDLRGSPLGLHLHSCNDFPYVKQNNTEAAYNVSNPNYEATINVTPKRASARADSSTNLASPKKKSFKIVKLLSRVGSKLGDCSALALIFNIYAKLFKTSFLSTFSYFFSNFFKIQVYFNTLQQKVFNKKLDKFFSNGH